MKKLFYSLCFSALWFTPLSAQQNMSLLGHLTYSNDLGSLWGWADGNGHEYALVGAYNGLSIVDVTNPTTPSQVQFVSTNNSFWHEVKTWDHYAYVVNESGGGLKIVDLSTLPNAVTHTNWTGGSLNLQTAHSLWIDENGIAYINGSNVGAGGVLFLNLNTNPMNPTHIGTYTNGYVHDCYARNDTMWTAQIYSGQFKVVNVANKSAPVVLASQSTPGNFTHNTALSDNGNYLFTTDEVSNSYVTAYDVSSLSNITETDRFQANPGTNSIAHNVHVKGNFLVTAYYRDGVIITDARDPYNLVKVGSYDTSPQSGSGYTGCWEAYPYLPSGNILAADIDEGLFVLGVTYVSACLVQGTVTDYSTGTPINGVSVSIVGASNTTVNTDLSGNYKTGYATAGTYNITFTKSGYYTNTITGVSLINGNTNTMNVTLKKNTLPQCVTPVNLFADNITTTSATLHWSDEYALLYTVKLKNLSNGTTQTITSPYNALSVTNLTPCTDYKFRVKAKCSVGNTTLFSPFTFFSTPGGGCGKLITGQWTIQEKNDVLIYPNPFTNNFEVVFTMEKSGHVIITLYDLSGREVSTMTDQFIDEGHHSFQVDASLLPSGIYLCTVSTGEGMVMKKVVKSE